MLEKSDELRRNNGISQFEENGEAIEQAHGVFGASPKTGYTVTMAWEVN